MTTLSTHVLDTRVAKGAALLDKEFPGWPSDVDLEALDTYDTMFCVAAQVACSVVSEDAFEIAMDRLGLDTSAGAVLYGFQLRTVEGLERMEELGPNATGTQIYAPLTDAWKRLIAARLETSA